MPNFQISVSNSRKPKCKLAKARTSTRSWSQLVVHLEGPHIYADIQMMHIISGEYKIHPERSEKGSKRGCGASQLTPTPLQPARRKPVKPLDPKGIGRRTETTKQVPQRARKTHKLMLCEKYLPREPNRMPYRGGGDPGHFSINKQKRPKEKTNENETGAGREISVDGDERGLTTREKTTEYTQAIQYRHKQAPRKANNGYKQHDLSEGARKKTFPTPHVEQFNFGPPDSGCGYLTPSPPSTPGPLQNITGSTGDGREPRSPLCFDAQVKSGDGRQPPPPPPALLDTREIRDDREPPPPAHPA